MGIDNLKIKLCLVVMLSLFSSAIFAAGTSTVTNRISDTLKIYAYTYVELNPDETPDECKLGPQKQEYYVSPSSPKTIKKDETASFELPPINENCQKYYSNVLSAFATTGEESPQGCIPCHGITYFHDGDNLEIKKQNGNIICTKK
jgi:hypothetical protein